MRGGTVFRSSDARIDVPRVMRRLLVAPGRLLRFARVGRGAGVPAHEGTGFGIAGRFALRVDRAFLLGGLVDNL